MASTSKDSTKFKTVSFEKSDGRTVNPRRRPKENLARKSLTREERANLKYAQFEPLYSLWLQYAAQMLPDNRQPDDRLLRMDWLGAMLMVTEAANESMVGLVGIVVLETRHTMQLISKQDKYLIIPKAGTVFQTAFRGKILTLFGDAMRFKPSQRGRKMRLRHRLPFSLK